MSPPLQITKRLREATKPIKLPQARKSSKATREAQVDKNLPSNNRNNVGAMLPQGEDTVRYKIEQTPFQPPILRQQVGSERNHEMGVVGRLRVLFEIVSTKRTLSCTPTDDTCA